MKNVKICKTSKKQINKLFKKNKNKNNNIFFYMCTIKF